MCGIAGYLNLDSSRAADPSWIKPMCDSIRHRGPDDEGFFREGPVALGMRRLSIIDLAGGHQPMFNEDESLVIVFNGEIYNFQELEKDCLQKHRLKTRCDTEAIVHLYEEFGP